MVLCLVRLESGADRLQKSVGVSERRQQTMATSLVRS
jgi:hypothetical protein